MRAQDIMSREVVTVTPATPIGEVARLMTEKRISGIPVVTESGTVIGIVSESDLIRRAELGSEPKHKWWLALFSDPDAMAHEYAKTHGIKAQDAMSRQVVTIGENADLKEIADTLERHRVKRVPVVRDGKLAGIVSRADLVRAFSNQVQASTPSTPTTDEALQQALLDKMRAQDWLEDTYLNVTVRDGIVELRGFIGTAEQRRALRVLIEETGGLRPIDDQLTIGLPGVGPGD